MSPLSIILCTFETAIILARLLAAAASFFRAVSYSFTITLRRVSPAICLALALASNMAATLSVGVFIDFLAMAAFYLLLSAFTGIASAFSAALFWRRLEGSPMSLTRVSVPDPPTIDSELARWSSASTLIWSLSFGFVAFTPDEQRCLGYSRAFPLHMLRHTPGGCREKPNVSSLAVISPCLRSTPSRCHRRNAGT